MDTSTSNWYTKPSKKLVTIVLLVWIISIILVVIGSMKNSKFALPSNTMLLLMIPSFVLVLKLLINYNKTKMENNS